MTVDIAFSSLSEIALGLRRKDYTAVEVTRTFLDRIARLDLKAGAYVDVYAEEALSQAQAADLQRSSGLPLGPLHGLPIALKDMCEIQGKVTTAGSAAWTDRVSSVTSAVYERVSGAGMIVLGKTHMVEFAAGGAGTNPLMGTPRNPWDWNDRHRIPGGSSSGSGVAVAAGLSPVAVGSDTGGSVRIPAALNNLTGLKTTFGRISAYGHVPLSRSLDSIGILSRTAADAGLLLDVLAGTDPRDPNTIAQPTYPISGADRIAVSDMRIAVLSPEQYPNPVEDDVQAVFLDAVRVFGDLGARVSRVECPLNFSEVTQANGIIAMAEAYQLHAAYIEDPNFQSNDFVRNRILTGKPVSACEYISALDRRRALTARFKDWMQSYDLLLTPTLPMTACPIDTIPSKGIPTGAFTRAVNYLQGCALSLPAGFSSDVLPIGIQLVSTAWQESLLLQAGLAFQRATDWHRRIPTGLA